jgi:RimJ/RimL family protein N-acetyltransferase
MRNHNGGTFPTLAERIEYYQVPGVSIAVIDDYKIAWGKGYGTDATRALLRYAFEEANLHRIELEVFAFNPRAIRVYEKCGFKLEGVRKQALYREGEWHDEHIMAILRDEWLALHER